VSRININNSKCLARKYCFLICILRCYLIPFQDRISFCVFFTNIFYLFASFKLLFILLLAGKLLFLSTASLLLSFLLSYLYLSFRSFIGSRFTLYALDISLIRGFSVKISTLSPILLLLLLLLLCPPTIPRILRPYPPLLLLPIILNPPSSVPFPKRGRRLNIALPFREGNLFLFCCCKNYLIQ